MGNGNTSFSEDEEREVHKATLHFMNSLRILEKPGDLLHLVRTRPGPYSSCCCCCCISSLCFVAFVFAVAVAVAAAAGAFNAIVATTVSAAAAVVAVAPIFLFLSRYTVDIYVYTI